MVKTPGKSQTSGNTGQSVPAPLSVDQLRRLCDPADLGFKGGTMVGVADNVRQMSLG